MDVRLVDVEHTECSRSERVDLADDLGPDRPATAGDQHPLAVQQRPDSSEVGLDLLAAEHVVDRQVADVA